MQLVQVEHVRAVAEVLVPSHCDEMYSPTLQLEQAEQAVTSDVLLPSHCVEMY